MNTVFKKKKLFLLLELIRIDVWTEEKGPEGILESETRALERIRLVNFLTHDFAKLVQDRILIYNSAG